MTTWTNNAEGGTSGQAVTTGNSGGASGNAFTTLSTDPSGSITFASAAAYRGALGYQLSAPWGSQAFVGTGQFTSGYQRLRFYVNLSAYPSGAIQFVQVLDGTGDKPMYLGLNEAGLLYVNDYNDNYSTYVTTNGVPLGQWVRIELICDPDTTNSGGRVRFCYALGDGAAIETIKGTGVPLGYAGTVQTFNLMKASYNETLPVAYLDEIATDNLGTNSTFMGPSSAGRFKVGATTPNLYVGSTGVGAVYCGTTQLYP